VVERGLAEGERVVVNGNFKIDSALQIQARPSMMLPEGGGASAPASQAAHVSPLFARGLGRVERALATLEDAAELEPRREAFAALEQAVDGVDPGPLSDEAAALWRELAMRLGNAAAEGRLAREAADADAALAAARHALERVRAAFGRHAANPVEGFVTPPGFRRQVDAVWRAYLGLQAALAGDDREAAGAARARIGAALGEADASALEADAAAAWGVARGRMRDALDGVDAGADLEALRVAFEPLSVAMRHLVEAFGVDAGEVYQVHCPMAFDFRGADWLQADEEVLNPYFGEEMLRCGTVRGALPQPAAPGEEPRDGR